MSAENTKVSAMFRNVASFGEGLINILHHQVVTVDQHQLFLPYCFGDVSTLFIENCVKTNSSLLVPLCATYNIDSQVETARSKPALRIYISLQLPLRYL